MKQQKRFVNWWEKTVEYAFVRKHMSELASAVPLDGNPEQWWGDLITEEGGEFNLIEFKRDFDAIDDEVDKYSSLKPSADIGRNHARLVRQQRPSLLVMEGALAHILVLGVEDEETLTMKLKLGWYWDADRRLVDIPPRENLPKSKGKYFAEYAEALRKIRQSESQSTSTGGLVCATKNGKLTAAIDLGSFQEIVLRHEKVLGLAPTQDLAPTPVRKPKRSFGIEP